MRRGGFVPIFVLLIVLLVGGATYYTYVQKTSGWNIFAPSTQSQAEQLRDFLLSDMKKRGIDPLPVTIKSLPIAGTWTANGYRYTVKNAYITEDVSDIGNWRDNFNIPLKNKFFVVEVNVRNSNTKNSSAPHGFVEEYFRIKINGLEKHPIASQLGTLGPQTDTIGLIYFDIPNETHVVTLLVGPITQPRVTSLDFDSSESTIRKGVFMSKEGYKQQYPVAEFVQTWHKDILDNPKYEGVVIDDIVFE